MKNLINFIKKHKKLTVLIIIILLMIINTIKNNPWLIPTPLLTKKQLFRFQMIYEAEHNSIKGSYNPTLHLNGTYNYELLSEDEDDEFIYEKEHKNKMYFKKVILKKYRMPKRHHLFATVINLEDGKRYSIDLKKKVLEGVDINGEAVIRYPFKKQNTYIGLGGAYTDTTRNIVSFGKENMYNLRYNEKYDFYCWKIKFPEEFFLKK